MRNNFVIRARSYTERQDAFKMQKVLKTVTAIGADSSAEPVQSAYFTLRSPVQSETYSNTFSTHSASSIGSEQSTFQVQNSITQRPDSGLPPTRFAETKYAASSADCPITHHSPHSIVEGEESLTALAMNSAGIDISGDCLLSDVTPRLVTRRASLTQQFGTGETTLEAQRLLQEKKRGHRRSRSENSIYSPCQHDGCGVNCAVTAGREYSKSNPAEAAKQSRLARNVSLMKGTKSIRRAVRRLRSFPSQGKLARKASMKTSSKLGKKDKVYSSEQIDEGEDARRNIDISYETDTSECDDSELDAVGTLSRRLSSELDLEDLLLCLPDDAEEIRRMDLFENQGGE
ncbi:hypothetical protein SARC_11186 [Sphaeroforma arctica JP610]|uniref:Uncharacterized protein n=1 Tax=Sphaeroforma arctica JP610 TaxID=667725 RepID=A0A0L0FHQ4_9EUKA|nr:hypothetical protein SARC_11186 [Sphaeroforma arctica JP610]KNC76309.1 hypothetical protein SARC_11186 [Sphaeroforma arctica JP610]|eukprot:XP_014150211.1 hypothetical protein SARC_11186 [Sphaeroforma arctica JP610]